jgi:hypothetical protein
MLGLGSIFCAAASGDAFELETSDLLPALTIIGRPKYISCIVNQKMYFSNQIPVCGVDGHWRK